VVAHDRVVCGLHLFKPREVAPGHLALVGLGTSGPGPLQARVAIAPLGIGAPLAKLMEPAGPDTPHAWLGAVRAVGDPLVQEAHLRR